MIEDHFWVVFVDPDNRVMNEDGHFLKRESANLRLPSSEGSQTSALIPWMRYADLEDRYLAAKGAYMKEVLTSPSDITLDIVWDGDGANTNAALTVFRHFDSATVVKGFVGDAPKTAWLIEYPLLERIHYLLVAGFDVYGNVGHQLNSRLYMDFLRMEGEFNFITLLPADARVPTREHWYRGASHRVKGYIYGDRISFDVDSGIPYGGGDPQTELFVLLREHLGPALDRSYALEAVGDEAITSSLEALAALEGSRLAWLPESAFLTITGHPDGADMSFSLLRNTGHSNVSHLFSEAREILPDENTLTVARGFVGAYPNAFYRVERTELAAFVEAVRSLQSESDYAALVDRFGVRRGDPGFWAHSDGIHAASAGSRPVEAGLFDYNRLENR